MKKILGLLMITLWLGLSSYSYAAIPSTCTAKRFRVTAYYSPLPDQAFYNMNSYEEEKIMNGNGTHGASWRGVFDGMIAAPKSYDFGTQIVFPWRWIGEVTDRGGRIVEEWERWQKYDRIDFWVGKWHDGLRRALSFGVQYIDAYICPEWTYSDQSIGFDYDVFPYYSDFFERMIRIISMRPWRDDLMVKSLQYFLVQLWYLNSSDTTGFYGPRTTAAVCAFQQKTLGLPASHQSCGTYGPQTRAALNQIVKTTWRSLKWIREQFASSEETVVTRALADEIIIDTPKKFVEPRWLPLDGLFGPGGEFESYTFTRPLVFNESSKVVRVLQRKLQRLGYWVWDEISGVYDTKTIQALYALQVAEWLLDGNEVVEVRGYFGPGTRDVINML
jgi:peptidoglycan hydrolase-like protein with peptidoglycan-binding domain